MPGIGCSRRSTAPLTSREGPGTRPITPQNFRLKSLSFDSLNDFVRCGLRSFRRQIRLTLDCETPASLAIERVLQRCRPGGFCAACVMILSTVSSGMEGCRPIRVKLFAISRSARGISKLR